MFERKEEGEFIQAGKVNEVRLPMVSEGRRDREEDSSGRHASGWEEGFEEGGRYRAYCEWLEEEEEAWRR